MELLGWVSGTRSVGWDSGYKLLKIEAGIVGEICPIMPATP